MFSMHSFRNHATTNGGSGTGQPGKYFDIDIYNRVLIFPKTSLKLPSQYFYGACADAQKFFSERFVVSKERDSVGWFVFVCTLSSRTTRRCVHIIYVYKRMRFWTVDANSHRWHISDKWCMRHVRHRIKHWQKLLLLLLLSSLSIYARRVYNSTVVGSNFSNTAADGVFIIFSKNTYIGC